MNNSIPPDLRQTITDQAGVVSRQQLLCAGISRNTITSKVRNGRWQRIHHGVYYLHTGQIGWNARLWAAVLYAGPGALLSHESAAEILGLTDRRKPVIQVMVPENRRVKAPPGVAIHYSSFDYPRWRPKRGDPPHTFYADTVIDLVAASGNLDDVVGWVSRGIAKKKVSAKDLALAAKARHRFRWHDRIYEVIGQVAGGSHFPLEYRYDRDVARAHGLPQAVKQRKFTKPDGSYGYRDRHYKEYALLVELDGREFHPEEQQATDRARDNEATATTGATLRYRWPDVTRTACETAAQVHRALAKRGYKLPLKPCSAACRALLSAAPEPATLARAQTHWPGTAIGSDGLQA